MARVKQLLTNLLAVEVLKQSPPRKVTTVWVAPNQAELRRSDIAHFHQRDNDLACIMLRRQLVGSC